jgi:hypothetical protein
MAKLGYQELINAIIRPPRAEYKVRTRIQDNTVHDSPEYTGTPIT